MDGSGPVYLDPPNLESWPKLTYDPLHGEKPAKRVDLDTLTHAEVSAWKPGDVLLLNGKLLTGRDAAHKRMTEMLSRGETLPVDFRDRLIYYVGPVDAVRDEAVGPAGPTTATRMDKFTRQMLEQTGLLGMVGKAERGVAAIDAIRDNKAVYLIAIGGAAYLVSKAIKHSRLVAFDDLGMEAIYEFDVVDMPVTVAVDTKGTSVHITGPEEWKERIAHSMGVGGVAILGQ
jgi:fumarate hydratase class I